MKHRASFLIWFLVLLSSGCLTVPHENADPFHHTYHDPDSGWTATLPSDWLMCDVPGGQFVRGLQFEDPTRLIIWTYSDKSVNDILSYLDVSGGVINQRELGERTTPSLQWTRYHAEARGNPNLKIELALAANGGETYLVLLVARRSEAETLVESVLLPAVDSFRPGTADPPRSVLSGSPPEPDYWPTQGWRTASAESQGMDSELLDDMLTLIHKEAIPLDSLTIVRHGYVVLDEVFPPFRPGERHELHSATKSITSALVGIALDDAKLTDNEMLSVNTPVLDFFPARRVANMNDQKRSMILEDLLTMTAGLDWVEWDAAYEPGTGNDLVLMIETAPDWSQYVLDRPMIADPGVTFRYNSGASHLLSAVVTEITGRPAADFAAERLLAPLGIEDFEWAVGPEGVTAGWANLRMQPRDLARIGLLYLHRGKWEDRQIIPADWVEASTIDQVADPLYEYGYQWWLDRVDGYAFMAGRFGQVAIVAPGQDMVIVFTSHLPDTISDVGVTRWLVERFIFPAAE